MNNETLGVISALAIIVVSGAAISYQKAAHGVPVETAGALFALVVLVTISAVGVRPFYRFMLKL